MKSGILPVLILFFAIACNPCDDCNTLSYEPTIELVFINADSLSLIEDSLSITTANSDALAALITDLNDTLSVLADSLVVITDSIANNGELEEERLSIENAITEFDAQRTIFSDDKSIQDSLTTEMNSVASTINSGLVFVSEIQIENGNSLSYTDSMTTFKIPLALDGSFYRYDISIENEINSIELDYDLFQELDARRNVLVRAEDIIVVNHSFDSLSACVENCLDGEATYIFYF